MTAVGLVGLWEHFRAFGDVKAASMEAASGAKRKMLAQGEALGVKTVALMSKEDSTDPYVEIAFWGG